MNFINLISAKMKWHQTRQSVIAENVANAETPGYQAKDITLPNFKKMLAASQQSANAFNLATTDHKHISPHASYQQTTAFKERLVEPWEVTHSKNAVVLEQEMMRLSENQLGFEMASNIYKRSVKLFKSALGKK